jgi:nitrogen-specific signal transduction histidine kinase
MANIAIQMVVAGSVVGGMISVALSYTAWRNRDVPAAEPFAYLLLSVGGWSFLSAAQILGSTPFEVYVFNRLMRAVAANVVPLSLLFVLVFAGYERYTSKRWLLVQGVLPVLYIVVSLTAPYHELASTPSDIMFPTVDGVVAPLVELGLAGEAFLAYSYVVYALTYLVLFRVILGTRSVHRNQSVVIALGMFIPIAANAAYQVGFFIHPGVDLTPVTLMLSGIVIALGLFKYDFLLVSPLANDLLVDELPDPVMVIDDTGSVIDLNPATRETFEGNIEQGTVLAEALPGLHESISDGEVYSVSSVNDSGGKTINYYDPQVVGINDQYGAERGRLLVLRDVSGQRRRQDRLEALQAATQQFITARTDDQIADLAVDYADSVLDQQTAALFLHDEADDTLEPAAMTEDVTEYFETEELAIPRADTPLWESFRSNSMQITDVSGIDWLNPYDRLLLAPVGDKGVLGFGSLDGTEFTEEDEQFASILAQTTQVALQQVAHEQELVESHATVERRSDQIEFFNGILRHALRNALLVIQGRASYLEDRVDPDETHHLDVIHDWCQDLAELNDEISAINDTVSATEDKRLAAMDLTEMLHDCAQELRGDYDYVDIGMQIDDDLYVEGNHLASRAILDVMLNAIEHNDATEPEIEVWTKCAADRVQVYIADNGPGLSDEMKETVFERDLRAAQSADGFGLYFVSVIMNLYGGTVWFEDNTPRGTIAILEFQATEPE